MAPFRIEFTWPDYKKFSGTTEAPSVERAVQNLLFRGLMKTRPRPYIALKAKEIIEQGAFKDLDEFPMPEKQKVVHNPLPAMDAEGDVTGCMKACVSAIRDALGANQTVQEIGGDVGLPVDRELAIPYNQGDAKPSDDDRHPHFFKDVNEVQDPFQF